MLTIVTRRSGLLRYARNDDQILAVRPELVEPQATAGERPLSTANCPSTGSGRTGGSKEQLRHPELVSGSLASEPEDGAKRSEVLKRVQDDDYMRIQGDGACYALHP